MLLQKKPWSPLELFLPASCSSSPYACGIEGGLHCHPYLGASLQLTGMLGLPSPVLFFWLLPPDYHSLGGGDHPRYYNSPNRQAAIYCSGQLLPSQTSFTILWVRSPLLLASRVSYWAWKRGNGQWVSGSRWVQQGLLKVMLLQQERHKHVSETNHKEIMSFNPTCPHLSA